MSGEKTTLVVYGESVVIERKNFEIGSYSDKDIYRLKASTSGQGVIFTMLKCPVCGRVYEDNNQVFCLSDGTALVRAENSFTPTVQMGVSGNQYPRPVSAPQNIPVGQPPRKGKTSLWILGGVGLLIFTLFIGVLLVVGVILSFKKGDDPVNTSNVSASPTPVNLTTTTGKYEPELKMAINSANAAQSTAYATLDDSGLRNYYSGEALKSYVNDVATLKKSKIYQISTMQKQDFEYFRINNTGTEAEVRVTETWETNVYKIGTRNCLLYYPPTPLPQTVYLKKASGGWFVDSTVYEAGVKKEPQPCPKKK